MTPLTLSFALLLAAQAAPPAVGDVVFTEIHPRASPSYCEWFEVGNAAGAPVELDGCYIAWQGETSRLAELDGFSLSAGQTAANPAIIGRDTDSCKDDDSAPLDCVAWAEPERLTCTAPVDIAVPGISVTDSVRGSLCIACGSPTDPALPCDPADAAITVVDAVGFSWDADFKEDCPLDDAEGRCSAQHDLNPSSAAANDDLDSWCITGAPSGTAHYSYDGKALLGSPGEGNDCPVPPPTCAAGDLVITEVGSRPQSSTDSWLELHASPSLSGTCSLAGCQVTDVGESSSRGIVLPAGTELSQAAPWLVLSQGGLSTLDLAGTIPAVDASGLYIGSSGDITTLSISCDGNVLDAVQVDEDFINQRCPERGCSAQLRPESWDPAANDSPDAWCVAPRDGNYTFDSAKTTDTTTYRITGTPAAETVCASYAWPAAGGLVVSELTADGIGATPDWFEVYNPGATDVELQWCELVQSDAVAGDTASEAAYEPRYRYFLSDDSHRFSVPAGGYAVFSKSDCLGTRSDEDGPFADTGTDLGSADEARTRCDDAAYIFRSLYLKSDVASRLDLVCEGVAIDGASFSIPVQQVLEGHSLALRPGSVGPDGASANDDWDNWCAAPFTGPSYDGADGERNWGTPGAANVCADPPQLKGSGVGCLCSSAPGQGPGAGPVLLLLGLLGAGLAPPRAGLNPGKPRPSRGPRSRPRRRPGVSRLHGPPCAGCRAHARSAQAGDSALGRPSGASLQIGRQPHRPSRSE